MGHVVSDASYGWCYSEGVAKVRALIRQSAIGSGKPVIYFQF